MVGQQRTPQLKKKIMGIPVADLYSQKVRDSDDVQLVDRLLSMKGNKSQWDVITELITAWQKKTPEEFQAYKTYVEDTRSNAYDPKHGQTKDGKDFDRRMVVIMPQPIMWMIRSLYTPQELKMDKDFFREFAKRFPVFQVPEKI